MSSIPDKQENPTKRLYSLSLLGAAFAGVCILFSVAFIWFQPDQLSLSDRYFPSPTATLTPTKTATPTATNTPTKTPTPIPTLTPHVLIAPPNGITVLEEKFDTNAHDWDKYYSNNSVRIKDGKLLVKSNEAGYIGMALCYGCEIFNKTYYIQAELIPEENTPINHGLSFCVGTDESYYVFDIRASTYSLSKLKDENWERLINSSLSKQISKYPVSNTLGVYYDKGKMDLYINGVLVESYQDRYPLICSWAGFFIDDGTANLIVDNAYFYNVALTPTPYITPTP